MHERASDTDGGTLLEDPNGFTLIDDASLVDSARAGDAEAFGALARQWFSRCWEVAWRIVHDAPAASVLASETLLDARSDLNALERPDEFGSWVLCRTRERALDRSRAARRVDRRDKVADAGDPSGQTPDPDADLPTAVTVVLGEDEASRLDLVVRHGVPPVTFARELGLPLDDDDGVLSDERQRLDAVVRAWALWGGGNPTCGLLSDELQAADVGGFDRRVVQLALSHAKACPTCRTAQYGRAAPASLYAGVPAVAAPADLRAAALTTIRAAPHDASAGRLDVRHDSVVAASGSQPSAGVAAPIAAAAATTAARPTSEVSEVSEQLAPAAGASSRARSELDEAGSGGGHPTVAGADVRIDDLRDDEPLPRRAAYPVASSVSAGRAAASRVADAFARTDIGRRVTVGPWRKGIEVVVMLAVVGAGLWVITSIEKSQERRLAQVGSASDGDDVKEAIAGSAGSTEPSAQTEEASPAPEPSQAVPDLARATDDEGALVPLALGTIRRGAAPIAARDGAAERPDGLDGIVSALGSGAPSRSLAGTIAGLVSRSSGSSAGADAGGPPSSAPDEAAGGSAGGSGSSPGGTSPGSSSGTGSASGSSGTGSSGGASGSGENSSGSSGSSSGGSAGGGGDASSGGSSSGGTGSDGSTGSGGSGSGGSAGGGSTPSPQPDPDPPTDPPGSGDPADGGGDDGTEAGTEAGTEEGTEAGTEEGTEADTEADTEAGTEEGTEEGP